jgi:hypothetical protein
MDLRVLLLGNAAACAVAGRRSPTATTHLDRMLGPLIRATAKSAAAASTWTRADCARSSSSRELERSTLERLTEWTLWTEETLTF